MGTTGTPLCRRTPYLPVSVEMARRPEPGTVTELEMQILRALRGDVPQLPAVPTSSGAMLCAVSPQERNDGLHDAWACKPAPQVAVASRECGAGATVVASRLAVRVRELCYPGEPPDSSSEAEPGELVKEKWLYIFREKKVVAVLQADAAGVRKKERSEGADFRGASQTGELVFDPGKNGARKQYALFLSPLRLSDEAIRILTTGDALAAAAVTVGPGASGMTVLVPDPYRWAADAQRLYHAPSAARFLALVSEGQFTARWLVASRVESWCLAEPSLKGQLKISPGDWLDAHMKVKSRLHHEARGAAAYLAHCVDNPGFVALQQACDDAGPDGISMGMQALASVTEGLVLTKEGIDLALRIATRKEFLTARYVFTEAPKPSDGKAWWNHRRWGWQAAASVVEDVIPATVEYLRKRGENPRLKVATYLRNIGIGCEPGRSLSRPGAVLLGNLEASQRITAGTLTRLERTKVRKEYERLVNKRAVKELQTTLERRADSFDRLHGFFKPVSDAARVTFGSLAELVNVTTAISEFQAARKEGDAGFYQGLSLVGAHAELAEHVATCVDELKRLGGVGKLVVKSMAAFLGAVSSVADFAEYETGLLDEGIGAYDYGVAAGKGVQMLGAGVSAVGGGLAFAEAIGAGSVLGAALGGWLLGAGAALVIGGALLVEALKLNDRERFAKLCFLGEVGSDPGAASAELPWTETVKLPSPDVRKQAEALLMLEASFGLMSSDSRLLIQPGILPSGSVFEIEVRIAVNEWTSSPYSLRVDLSEDMVTQLDGPTRLPNVAEIKRDRDGNVTEISIGVKDPKLPARLPTNKPARWRAISFVRLALGSGIKVPDDKEKWVEIVGPGAPVVSRDKTVWRATTKSVQERR